MFLDELEAIDKRLSQRRATPTHRRGAAMEASREDDKPQRPGIETREEYAQHPGRCRCVDCRQYKD